MRATSKRFKSKRRTDANPNQSSGQSQRTAPSSYFRLIKEFRLLGIIVGCGVLLGVYEIQRSDLPAVPTDVPPQMMLDSQLNLAKTMLELYPDRSYGYFLKSYQAGMCWELGYQPEVCEEFPFRDLRDVKSALLEAMERGGNYDQEGLFHFYAFILVRLNEPPEVIDEAVRTWRRHYPYSNKPDPRTMK